MPGKEPNKVHELGTSSRLISASALACQVVAILLPFTVARTLLTLLRTTPLAVILPLDQNMRMHKLLGYHFFLWSSLHTVCHLVNAARISDPSRYHTPPAAPIPTQAEYYAEETQVQITLLLCCTALGRFFTDLGWQNSASTSFRVVFKH